MPLTPFPVEAFAGLNLADDPTDVGPNAAVDMLNVEIPRAPGRLSTRGGLSKFNTGTTTYHRIAALDSTMLAGFRNTGAVLTVDKLLLNGAAVSSFGTTWGNSSTRVTSTMGWMFGGSSLSVAVASRSGASNEVAQVFGTTPPPPFVGKPRYLALTNDSRIAEAHFVNAADAPSGANGTPSTVFFSDPGAAGFTSTSWEELDPNDGDEITGMVVWRELLFVIKRSRLYIFYGTSTRGDGTPEFDYRRVDLPSRARATTNGGGENIVAASNGVYLLLADGVYVTTGGPPVPVSAPVRPVFDGSGAATVLFPTTGDWNISYAANRVYLTYTVGGTFRTLLYDIIAGMWLLWDLSAGQAVQPTNVVGWVDSSGAPAAFVASGAKAFSLSPTATSDDGTAIAWSYQTGYSSAGGYFRQRIVSSGERKKHFKTDILGSGTVTHQLLALNSRPNDVADPGASVTLGTAAAIARGSRRRGVRGTHFAHKLSGSGQAVVSGLTYWLSEISLDT